jgi:squalene-hopene/tetraprenyl-beta-curcumene cyclase
MPWPSTLFRPCFLIGVVMAMAAGSAVTVEAGDAEDPARIRRAISYLDGRQEAWFQFASAERGQGTNKTTCVSCHTGLTYALARPALTGFVAGAGPSTAENRMIAHVGVRVQHWAELDTPPFRLMYDSTDRKKAESRGTESVFNALLLARRDQTQRRASASGPTQLALRHMWATQATEGKESGSWDWMNFGLEPWEASGSRAFGASLAAMAVSSAPGYLNGPLDEKATRGVSLLREYLRGRFPDESLYNRLWILDASSTFTGLLSVDQKNDVVKQLLVIQREDGGWALATLGDFERVDGTTQAHDSDGYATGLALHVLIRSGTPADRPELVKAVAWLRSHQQDDGSWPGVSVNKKRDPATFVGKLMIDAATAFSASALVEAVSSERAGDKTGR